MELDSYKNIHDFYKNTDLYEHYRIVVLTVHNTKYSDEKYNIELQEDTIIITDNKGLYEVFDVDTDIDYVFVTKIN